MIVNLFRVSRFILFGDLDFGFIHSKVLASIWNANHYWVPTEICIVSSVSGRLYLYGVFDQIYVVSVPDRLFHVCILYMYLLKSVNHCLWTILPSCTYWYILSVIIDHDFIVYLTCSQFCCLSHSTSVGPYFYLLSSVLLSADTSGGLFQYYVPAKICVFCASGGSHHHHVPAQPRWWLCGLLWPEQECWWDHQ